MKYNKKEKLLKEIDRRKLQKFEIETKFRIMKTVLGGNLKYRLQLNKNYEKKLLTYDYLYDKTN